MEATVSKAAFPTIAKGILQEHVGNPKEVSESSWKEILVHLNTEPPKKERKSGPSGWKSWTAKQNAKL